MASDRSYFGMFYNYFFFVNITNVCYIVLCQAGFLWESMDDIMVATESTCTVGMGVLNILRFVNMRMNQKKLKKIIKTFAEDIWFDR